MANTFASGVLTTREPITLPGGSRTTHIFCRRWSFQSDEDLEIAPFQSRGPVARAWFAVATAEPEADPQNPNAVVANVLAMIPGSNVLGFVACDSETFEGRTLLARVLDRFLAFVHGHAFNLSALDPRRFLAERGP